MLDKLTVLALNLISISKTQYFHSSGFFAQFHVF